MKPLKRMTCALALFATCSAYAGEFNASALNGKALFKEYCAMCHDKFGMGTGLLARRVQPAELTERDNLTVEYVVMFARNGIGNMPAIPRGEVSDEKLRAIAEYLATTHTKNTQSKK